MAPTWVRMIEVSSLVKLLFENTHERSVTILRVVVDLQSGKRMEVEEKRFPRFDVPCQATDSHFSFIFGTIVLRGIIIASAILD